MRGEKPLFLMRDNFRPNLRITTNILMVIGTFLIAINLGSAGKQDKNFIQRRDDCADVSGLKISLDEFIKKYNLAAREGYKFNTPMDKETVIGFFCSYYKIGSLR